MDTPPTETGFSALREAHLRDYWKIVWQARWTILAAFLVVVGGTAVYTYLQMPIYQATAIIEIEPKARRVAVGQDVSGLGAGGMGWFAEEKYHNTQVEILKSRDVSRRVVQALDLESHPRFAKTTDPIDAFRRGIRATPRRDTGLIAISYAGGDANEITVWVNEVANQYVKRNFEKARGNVRVAMEQIAEQVRMVEEDFATAEDQRFQKLSDASSMTSEDQVEILHEKLKAFNQKLTTVQFELNRLRDTLRQIQSLQERSGDVMSVPELAQDLILKDLHADRVGLERNLEAAKVEFRPGHPTYEKASDELATVKGSLRERVSVIFGTLQNSYDLALENEKYLKGEIRKAENMSLAMARDLSALDLTKTQSDTKKGIFEVINKKMTEVQLSAQLLTNNVSVLDEATPPRFPMRPRKRMNLAIGAFFGLFFGLAVAFFLDYLDNTFRTPEDIEKYLGLSVLGVIPKMRTEGVGHRAVKEAYQSLRTSVIFCSKNRQRKVLLITSTAPQEGKSATVSNVGRALSQAGERVIILDCDLRRPTQHMLQEAERDHGLTNYLAASDPHPDWRPFAKSIGDKNLWVMTCGPIPPSPPELLGSERFLSLLTELRGQFDWILIDSPPAASLADATLLATVADMVVLVIKHNHTDRDLVIKSVQRIRAVNPNIAGAVLNNVDIERAYRKDYYYAGYYYYGQEKGEKTRKRKVVKKAVVG